MPSYFRRFLSLTTHPVSLSLLSLIPLSLLLLSPTPPPPNTSHLRSLFDSNHHPLHLLYHISLPSLSQALPEFPLLQTATSLSLLRTPSLPRSQKTALWYKVGAASFAHLLASLYLLSLLYTTLSLQVNLLARHLRPPHALPDVPRSNFLAEVRATLVGPMASQVVEKAHSVAESLISSIPLTKQFSSTDAATLVQDALPKLAASFPDPHHMLLALQPHISDAHIRPLRDEALDLCDALNFNHVVLSNAQLLLTHTLNTFNSLHFQARPTIPFVHLFSSFSKQATQLLTPPSSSSSQSAIESLLSSSITNTRFSAAVFLSGDSAPSPALSITDLTPDSVYPPLESPH